MIHEVRPLIADGTLSSDILAASSHSPRMTLLPQDVHVILGSTVWAPDSLPHRHPLLVSGYTVFSLGSGLERIDNNRKPSVTVPGRIQPQQCALHLLVPGCGLSMFFCADSNSHRPPSTPGGPTEDQPCHGKHLGSSGLGKYESEWAEVSRGQRPQGPQPAEDGTVEHK